MKKTEKIEIRISPEDKEALARRAEAEGRPVSEVVRDMLDGNGVTMATQKGRTRKSQALPMATFVLGALMGGGVMQLAGGSQEQRFVLADAELWSDPNSRHSVQAHAPAGELDGLQMSVPTRDGDYRLDFRAVPAGAGGHVVEVTICIIRGDTCEAKAAPSIRTALNRGGTLEAEWGEGSSVNVRLSSYNASI